VPGDRHGHHDGLAGAGRHFGAEAPEFAAIGGNVDADLLGGGRFCQPDERFNRFELTKEKAPGLEILRVGPVFEKALGDAADTRIAGIPPGLYPWPDLVDERDRDENAGVVEGF
jgi:hypothetical protein